MHLRMRVSVKATEYIESQSAHLLNNIRDELLDKQCLDIAHELADDCIAEAVVCRISINWYAWQMVLLVLLQPLTDDMPSRND